MQLSTPAAQLKLANRELDTVAAMSKSSMSLRADDGRTVNIDPTAHTHIDHGYAVTSHSSQGQTADRVLIHVDTQLGAKHPLNNRMVYVAVSRGAYDAQIFTDNREELSAKLGYSIFIRAPTRPRPISIRPSRLRLN